MNPLGFAAGGGLMGGLLGQADQALGAPRRMVMGALGGLAGQPDVQSGSQLLQALFGIDPKSAGGHIGGLAADIGLDPLTYMGALGGVVGHAFAPAGEAANVAAELANLDKLEAAANAAKARNAAVSAYQPNVGGMGMTAVDKMLPENVAGLGTEVSRTFPNAAAIPPADPSMVSQGIKNNPFLRATAGANPGMSRADLGGMRAGMLGENAAGNTDALRAAGENLQGQGYGGMIDMPPGERPMMTPGAMLDPTGSAVRSPMAGMSPDSAIGSIPGIRERMLAEMAKSGQMTPAEIAAVLGTATGAIGGGVGAGMSYNRR